MYTLDRTLGGPQNLSGRYGEETVAPDQDRPPTAEPVAHLYTDLSYAGSELDTDGSYCSSVVINVTVESDASHVFGKSRVRLEFSVERFLKDILLGLIVFCL
jgi:hypothetical protein